MEEEDLHNAERGERSAEKKKPKTLYEPTESMLAAQREFERRKNEIKPEDDPFWEKRGGKGGKLFTKFEEIPEKTPKTSKECSLNISPLPTNSRLLTPTQATIFASYQKEDPPKEKHITSLPANSHLLTPTKASSRGEYQPTPPVKEKPLTPRSNSGDISSPSHQPYTPPVNCRLLELTTSRKSAAYEKKIVDADPREAGWSSILTPFNPKSPLPTPPEIYHTNPYKNVKSKLYNPTIASVRQKWCDPHAGEGDGNDGDNDNDGNGDGDNGQEQGDEDRSVQHSQLQGNGNGNVNGNGNGQRHRQGGSNSPPAPFQRSSSQNSKRFSHIHSRLYEPTAAHIASQWCNKPVSPPSSPPHVQRRHSSQDSDYIPAVQAKTTQAQIHNQRSKYVPPDDGDIAKKQPPATASSSSSSRRSKSVPVFGRIYSPPPPPVMERRSSLRSPRTNRSEEEATIMSPYAALVNPVETPVVRRQDERIDAIEETSAQDDIPVDAREADDNGEREGRLSRLFPEATKAIEVVKEVTNPYLLSTQTEDQLEEKEDKQTEAEEEKQPAAVVGEDEEVEEEEGSDLKNSVEEDNSNEIEHSIESEDMEKKTPNENDTAGEGEDKVVNESKESAEESSEGVVGSEGKEPLA